MSKIRVYPYRQGSKSAKTLAEALGGKVLKLVGSKFKAKREDVIINWGSTGDGIGAAANNNATVLNHPDFVKNASNKLKFFQALDFDDEEPECRIPQYWTNKDDITPEDFPIVCRTVLAGHSGEGIVIAETPDQLVDAPLYTKYIKKKDEYRVHIVGVEPCFIQRKARKLDVENPDWKVRNLANGFVFCEVPRDEVPRDVIVQAQEAIDALELDFGGVDVIWNEREQQAYVLEVNTACGLEERTAQRYADAIKEAFL